MPGRPDIEVVLAALDRYAPITKTIRDQIDRQEGINDPAWCSVALNALGQEDRALEADEGTLLRDLKNSGEDPRSNRQALTLRAARLRLRETVAEVCGIAVEVCASSPPDTSAAKDLLMRQRAELWSVRTGFGAQRDTLEPLPRPRGRRYNREAIEQAADVIAALRMAQSPEEQAAVLQQADRCGLDVEKLRAQHEGKAVVVEPLAEAIERRVTVLAEERGRDPVFLRFLILDGWIFRRL